MGGRGGEEKRIFDDPDKITTHVGFRSEKGWLGGGTAGHGWQRLTRSQGAARRMCLKRIC